MEFLIKYEKIVSVKEKNKGLEYGIDSTSRKKVLNNYLNLVVNDLYKRKII